jgi:hypothetical protein
MLLLHNRFAPLFASNARRAGLSPDDVQASIEKLLQFIADEVGSYTGESNGDALDWILSITSVVLMEVISQRRVDSYAYRLLIRGTCKGPYVLRAFESGDVKLRLLVDSGCVDHNALDCVMVNNDGSELAIPASLRFSYPGCRIYKAGPFVATIGSIYSKCLNEYIDNNYYHVYSEINSPQLILYLMKNRESTQTVSAQAQALRTLEADGLPVASLFDRLPDELGGIEYTTARKLRESGVTRYSHNRLLDLARSRNLPGTYQVVEQWIYTPLAVRALRDLEHRRLTEPSKPGSMPGWRRST